MDEPSSHEQRGRHSTDGGTTRDQSAGEERAGDGRAGGVNGERAGDERAAEVNGEQAEDAHGGRSGEASNARAANGHDDRGGETAKAVEVANLRKEFGGLVAVDDVSFSVERGEVVGLLGPNGAGKTTCIKCTLGLVEPTAGSVRIGGVDTGARPKAAFDRVGAMLEGARNIYWRLTVRENLEFFAGIAGRAPADVRARHDELLDRLALTEKADEPVRDLSRGMKQKVSLATTLARDVDVAFLDEPTLGLDVESSLELRNELASLAAKQDTAIVVSSHDMDVIQELCDRVIVLSEGRVIANDSVSQLLSLFRTQTYRLVFTEPPGQSLRSTLSSAVELDGWDRGPEHTTATVALSDGNQLPEVTGQIVENGGNLQRVDTVEPDLEEVFLELTRGDTDD